MRLSETPSEIQDGNIVRADNSFACPAILVDHVHYIEDSLGPSQGVISQDYSWTRLWQRA